MTINSLGGYSAYGSMYTSNSSSVPKFQISGLDEENTNGVEGGKKGPGGPPPGGRKGPGGPGGGRGPGGPNLDTDNDDSWSKDELSEYAAYSSDELGISLDVDDIMSKYDSDEDGKINSTERESLAKNNALKLPSPDKIRESMMAKSNNNINFNSLNTSNGESSNTNSSIDISSYLSAYSANQNYSADTIKSLFESVV